MDIDALDKQVRSLMAFRQWAEPILAALIQADQPAEEQTEEPVDTSEAPVEGGEAAPADAVTAEQPEPPAA